MALFCCWEFIILNCLKHQKWGIVKILRLPCLITQNVQMSWVLSARQRIKMPYHTTLTINYNATKKQCQK